MSFRFWCREKWFEHIDELQIYGQPVPYTAQDYFQKYKYWLRREFRYHQVK